MSEVEELRRRLEALVAEAREAGRYEELRAAWLELATSAEPSPGEAEDVPQRFGLVGHSPAMRELFELLERVAPTDVPVLV